MKYNPFSRSQQSSMKAEFNDKLDIILIRTHIIMKELEDLQTEVAKVVSVEKSAVTLLGGLKVQLDAAIAASITAGNPTALNQLSADLTAQTDALAASITANTPIVPAAPV